MNKNLFSSDYIKGDKERYYSSKKLSAFSGFAVVGSILINVLIVVYAVITSMI